MAAAKKFSGSLDDKMRAVRYAVEQRFFKPVPPEPADRYCWFQLTVFDASAVFEKDGKLWEIAYAMDGGAAVLADGEARQVQWQPVPVKESKHEGVLLCPLDDDGQLLEAAATPSGKQWRVLIISEGMSKNRNQYGRKCLEAALPLYEGVQVYADHQETPRQFGRSVNDCIGFVKNVAGVTLAQGGALAEGQVENGVYGLAATLVVTKPKWQTELREAYEAGNPSLYGLSHDVKASAVMVLEAGSKRGYYDVQKIESVGSVDLVTNPAAGGRLFRMVASDTRLASFEGDEAMLTRMIEAIKASGNAGLIARLEGFGATPNEDQILGLYQEALKVPAAAAPVREAVTTPAAAAPAGATVADVQRLTEGQNAMRVQLLEATRRGLRHFVEAQLGGAALPGPAKDNLRAIFEARLAPTVEAITLSETEVTTAIAGQVEMFGKIAEAGGLVIPGSATITGGKDKLAQLKEAFDDWFDPKKPARSFRQLYVELTGDTQITGRTQEAKRLTESLNSTSLDQILGDSITRRMVQEYQASDLATWRNTVARVTPVSDFRTQRRMRLGGYGNLTAVAQGQAYPSLTSPTDEEATYAPTKRGGTEQLTLEMITNDDVGVIRLIPQRLARAAAQTLHEFVYDFMRTNATVYDAVALAAAGHGNNIITTAFSGTNIQTARMRMKNQSDMSNSKRIGLKARYVFVPNDLEDLAYQYTGADKMLPDSSLAAQAAPAAPNPVRRYNLTPIVVEYWPDANDYWVTASLDQCDMIEVGFLNGREDPELFVQDAPTVGSMFSNDALTYKLRHIYGGAVIDFRGFVGGIVP